MLSPRSDRLRYRKVIQQFARIEPRWRELYLLAELQWCTPFAYEQLRINNCLDLIPEDIRDPLRNDCLANRLRNLLLRTELVALLKECIRADIAVVLLKGAATFTDELYTAGGARTMLDLDLLVREERLDEARQILVARGYEEEVDPHKDHDGLPTDVRHAHINAYCKPGTPVVVELHYHVAYGQGGRVLPVEMAWKHTQPGEVDGVPCLVLSPTYRLLHNTVHGLIPSCDYIKGEIRLLHLVEFGYLVLKYEKEIDWQAWLQAGQQQKVETAFLAWLVLAQQLLGMPWPLLQQPSPLAKLHGYRLRVGTVCRPMLLNKELAVKISRIDRVRLWLVQAWYYLQLPGWVWDNVCYAEGWLNLPVRLQFLLKKVLSRDSRAKI